ncbi:MAG: hypothetical protein ACFFA3_16900 [Promethearchaeota archaeon]
MDEVKNLIDDLGIAAFEANTKIASFALISKEGELIYQTENWDLNSSMEGILKVINGEHLFILNDAEFLVKESNAKGIITTNDLGMGHVIFAFFQGGTLVSYAMQGADPIEVLTFLSNNISKFNGKI